MFYLMIWSLALGFISCNKGNDPAEDDPTPTPTPGTASISLLVQREEVAEPYATVYVFAAADKTDPDSAIAVQTTDREGKLTFTANSLNKLPAGSIVFLQALEELKPGEYSSYGQLEVDLPEDGEVEQTMEVSARAHYGTYPSAITHTLAMSEYERWKRQLVVSCNGMLRPVADPRTNTLVEAVGFGLLMAAYAEDKPTFDGIYAFYKSKRTARSNNMMGWSVTCDGFNDEGSATDGDIDVAFALLVASQHWGTSYKEEALDVLEVVSSSVIATCSVRGESVKILYPGYSGGPWGGCGMTDLMYHTPAFFRIFAEVTGDPVWTDLVRGSYVLLEGSAHPETGLVPDWQTAAGVPGPGGRAGHFGYDACRAPWRLALDYLWNGNLTARDWCEKVTGWVARTGPANLVDGYELDGTPRGTNGLNSSFLGGFTVAAMTVGPNRVNQFANVLAPLNDTYWFNHSTRCLYLFTLSGNFTKPVIN